MQGQLTCAVFSGSMSSGGGGVRAVFTAQNRQPLVQVSPAFHRPLIVNDTCTCMLYLHVSHIIHYVEHSQKAKPVGPKGCLNGSMCEYCKALLLTCNTSVHTWRGQEASCHHDSEKAQLMLRHCEYNEDE